MGVSEQLARLALRRAHVLIVECPGDPMLRIRAEAGVAREGWATSTSPADADVLLVCGTPGAELGAAVDRLWDQMVAPRVRVAGASASDLPEAIGAARRALLDGDVQRVEARRRTADASGPEHAGTSDMPMDMGVEGRSSDHAAHGSMDHGSMDRATMSHESTDMDHGSMDQESMDHESMDMDHGTMNHESTVMDHGSSDHGSTDHGTMDHGTMDHGSMDHGTMDHGSMDMDHGSMDHGSMDMDHGSMDHGSMSMGHGHHMHMDMSGPAGIPLAQGEDDRDGLEMDALHVTLGPILPAWPADLVLRCTLHGDTIAAAEAEILPAAEPPPLAPDERGALLVDAAARVVQLAGWDPVGIALRRVRDGLLDPGFDRRRAADRLQRLDRRIRRSRTLRWSVRGVRPSSGRERAAGPDAHELLLALLAHAVEAVGGSPAHAPAPLPAVEPSELASAVVGQDLATARLVVASLTPWGAAGRTPATPAMEATDG